MVDPQWLLSSRANPESNPEQIRRPVHQISDGFSVSKSDSGLESGMDPDSELLWIGVGLWVWWIRSECCQVGRLQSNSEQIQSPIHQIYEALNTTRMHIFCTVIKENKL